MKFNSVHIVFFSSLSFSLFYYFAHYSFVNSFRFHSQSILTDYYHHTIILILSFYFFSFYLPISSLFYLFVYPLHCDVFMVFYLFHLVNYSSNFYTFVIFILQLSCLLYGFCSINLVYQHFFCLLRFYSYFLIDLYYFSHYFL